MTPALALIDYIQENHPQDRVVFVGRKYSQEKLKQLALEKKEIRQRGIQFIHLKAVKKISLIYPFLKSLFESLKILNQEKPDIFVSFGGYLAIPLALAAKLKKIKIITHEQTHAAGFANQIIAKIADTVAISYPSSTGYFSSKQIILTGNLVRKEILSKRTSRPGWLIQKKLKPIFLVTGGSQGSAAINLTIQKILPELTKDWTLIHLCGNDNQNHQYQESLEKSKKKLPQNQQQHYFVRKWVSAAELSWIYDHAFGAISRSGANTTMELTHKNVPTIFIPLANSHHDEQLKNAQDLTKKNAALLLPQNELSTTSILKKIEELKNKHQQLKLNLEKIILTTTATKKFYQLIDSLSHDA